MMTAPSTPISTADDLRGLRAVVLGLARSGVAASRFLADAGAVVAAYDRRPPSELADAISALGARPVRLALGVNEADATALLELSELQLPTITRGVDVALYTNIAEDHLDRHGTIEAYRAVKSRLAELTAPTGRVVLNHDDPGCRDLAERLPPASVAWYGMERPGHGRAEAWIEDGWLTLGDERVVAAHEVRLPGSHMLADVLGAALAASLIGVRTDAIGDAARTFEGVRHRLETIAERDGVRWINDSQATIPQAPMGAFEAFAAPVVL